MSVQSRVETLIDKITDPSIKKELIVHSPEFTSFRQAISLVSRLDSANKMISQSSTTRTSTTTTTTTIPPTGKVLSITDDTMVQLQKEVQSLREQMKQLRKQ